MCKTSKRSPELNSILLLLAKYDWDKGKATELIYFFSGSFIVKS